MRAIWAIPILLMSLLLGEGAGFGSDIIVSGWPRPANPMESNSFIRYADDPLLGRLACPPLERYNLAQDSFEQLILRSISTAGENKWQLKLRNGIYWWSGKEVRAQDLKVFLETNLRDIIRFKAEDLWNVPEFTVVAKEPDDVTVTWASNPIFGPHVLAGVPLFQGEQEKTECAGLYKITQDNFRAATLVPNPGYTRIKKSIGIDYVKSAKDADFVFQFAENYGGSPWVRFSDEDTDCRHTIALSTFSLMVWNSTQKPLDNSDLRRVFAKIIPRGALLSYGAGSLGQLVSAPIPRTHPGYDGGIEVISADMASAANELEKLGFRRPQAEGARFLPDGKPMQLRIRSESPSTTLVEKIVADAFSALGIALEFVHGYVSAGPFDGQLTAVSTNQVTSDLLFLLHSKWGLLNQEQAVFKDSELDKMLEQYTLSLTSQPDFKLLKTIHGYLSKTALLTPLLQHSACLTGNKSRHVKKIDVNDPDWLKNIVR